MLYQCPNGIRMRGNRGIINQANLVELIIRELELWAAQDIVTEPDKSGKIAL